MILDDALGVGVVPGRLGRAAHDLGCEGSERVGGAVDVVVAVEVPDAVPALHVEFSLLIVWGRLGAVGVRGIADGLEIWLLGVALFFWRGVGSLVRRVVDGGPRKVEQVAEGPVPGSHEVGPQDLGSQDVRPGSVEAGRQLVLLHLVLGPQLGHHLVVGPGLERQVCRLVLVGEPVGMLVPQLLVGVPEQAGLAGLVPGDEAGCEAADLLDG